MDALKKLGLGTAHMLSAKELIENEVTIFKDVLRIDVLTKLKKFTFEEVFPRRKYMRIEKLLVPVISLEDLLSEKKAVSRSKDLDDFKVLKKLKKSL